MTHLDEHGGGGALAAEALSKRYRGGRTALQALDLTIGWGGLTALVGPNGAGKSTLIKAWVGLERPTAGRSFVAGIDPWRDRRMAISRLGYVPQSPALYRGLTVADHLAYAASVRPTFDRPYAERRLDELDVPLRSKTGHLSGGQQAQVALAIALGLRAPVLLLDEPLASLDPLARREFLNVLADAVLSDGLTALLSSHVVTDIEQACDRLVVLGAGRKVLDAPLEQAIADHWVSQGDNDHPIAGARSIASFAGSDRREVTLWRRVAVEGSSLLCDGRRATLEEVVLGYLAAGRMSPRPLS